MGMDLAIYPFDYFWPTLGRQKWAEQENITWITSTRLDTVRDYRFYAQISKEVMGDKEGVKAVCEPKPLPKFVRVMVYQDEGLKERKTDPYGSKLTYVTAGELGKVEPLKGSWNESVITFIRTFPEDTPVILWWH
jgi:hypothetical protein